MSTRKLATVGLVLVGLAFGSGCDMFKKDDKKSSSKTSSSAKSSAQKSLYDRLGGETAITKVVDDFVNNAAGDPKVNFTRKGHPNEWEATPENVAVLKRRLVEFVANAAGGPQKYTGKGMPEAHAKMEITDAEFDALAAHLSNSLKKFNVPQKEHDELMQVVGGTRGQIVGK